MSSTWAKVDHNVTILFMLQTEPLPRILHADPEHGPLRFTVFMILIINLIVGFLLVQLLLNLLASDTRLIEFAMVLSCAFAIPLALGITWFVELLLKREWHSGKSLTLENSTLIYTDQKNKNRETQDEEQKISFDWSKRVNAFYWYFKLKGYPRAGRERRVSDKWFGLACQLQQDDYRLIVFSYLPPKRAAKWIENNDISEPFVEISLEDVYKQAGKKKRRSAPTRPKIGTFLLTSSEGRYWLAEQKRWQEGLELKQEDFEFFVNYVEQKNGVES